MRGPRARYPSPYALSSASGGRKETRQPGKGFGSNVPSGGQGRAFSNTPSFGRRTSSPPQGSQPAHRVGPRRVAGVRTIPGRREDDRVVVPREPEVRREVEEEIRNIEEEGGGSGEEEEDNGDESYKEGFVYQGTIAGNPVKVFYNNGADDIFVDSKFAHNWQLHICRFSTPMRCRMAVKENGRLDATVSEYVPQVPLCIQGYSEIVGALLADLDGYDVILGRKWSDAHNVKLDHPTRSLRFSFKRREMILNGGYKKDENCPPFLNSAYAG
uniref:Uncharacterized protein n=1 Tax=Chromera velia CCMP2878 TaxID=1169474 RepID=A0A0G4HPZ1_9ALVE|eukprot:Cvel_29997.t1-p1 / transcript=Cvel_29997.t1 / gene=Cvel_29997 / organism=Chromera_velia_CCMP2878 / gene_product=hypothetical protein / transcript_product=hypothetical protein / location=Cvel_scaffold4209:2977-3786(-) / protein_length=270 / sequence_SO=supercontig / SO=protein_coding / is_pseudo=false